MSDDSGFVSVSLVRWMLKQIEKETDLTGCVRKGWTTSRVQTVINRFDRIDTLCEEFHKRIDGERAMLAEVMKFLNEP